MRLVEDYLRRKGNSVVSELQLPNRSIADIVSANLARKTISIVEVKTALHDLRRDIDADKWTAYKAYANEVWFAVPKHLAEAACTLLPEFVGVFSLSNTVVRIERKGRLRNSPSYTEIIGLMLAHTQAALAFGANNLALPESTLVQMVEIGDGIYPHHNQYAAVSNSNQNNFSDAQDAVTGPAAIVRQSASVSIHKGRPPRFHVKVASNWRRAPERLATWGTALDSLTFERATRIYEHLHATAHSNKVVTFRSMQDATGLTRRQQVTSYIEALRRMGWLRSVELDRTTSIEVLTIPPMPERFVSLDAFPSDRRKFFPEAVDVICKAWEQMYVRYRPTLYGNEQLRRSGRATLGALFRDVLDVERFLFVMQMFLTGSVPLPDGSRESLHMNAWPKYQRYGPTPHTFSTYYDTVNSRSQEIIGQWCHRTGKPMPLRYYPTDAELTMAALRHSRRASLKAARHQ